LVARHCAYDTYAKLQCYTVFVLETTTRTDAEATVLAIVGAVYTHEVSEAMYMLSES